MRILEAELGFLWSCSVLPSSTIHSLKMALVMRIDVSHKRLPTQTGIQPRDKARRCSIDGSVATGLRYLQTDVLLMLSVSSCARKMADWSSPLNFCQGKYNFNKDTAIVAVISGRFTYSTRNIEQVKISRWFIHDKNTLSISRV